MVKQSRDNQRPAVLENADHPPAFSAPPYCARNRRFCDVQRPVGLSFCFAPNGQQPPSGDGNRHPQSLRTQWVIHTRVLPLPTTPFAALEALFYPDSQTVPAGIGAFGRKIGQYQPRVLMVFAPVPQ